MGRHGRYDGYAVRPKDPNALRFRLLMTDHRYLVATTTVWSGASYIYTKDAVKILSQPQPGSSETPRDAVEKADGDDQDPKIRKS